MTDRHWGWVSLVGLLLFGLTGFIDMLDRGRFLKIKTIALGIGTAILIRTLWVLRKENQDEYSPDALRHPSSAARNVTWHSSR